MGFFGEDGFFGARRVAGVFLVSRFNFLNTRLNITPLTGIYMKTRRFVNNYF